MSSPSKETEEPSSSNAGVASTAGGSGDANTSDQRPPAKRQISTAVIEISDTDSDDSDVCAVNSYQASADEVKRIRREYSSSSSSSDYSSDSESPWEDDSVVIEDKISGKVVRTQLNTRANRMDDPKLNPALKSQDVIDKVKTYWEEEKDHESDEVTLTCKPFRLCRLHGLLQNPDVINNIVDDMNTLDWSRKKMDLYEFHQTTDLANLTWQRSIRGIYEMLKTEIMSWVSQVTGLELTSVSASCSLYGPGDHLLVHDDRLGDRRVAFIIYLAPWTPRAPPPHALHNGAGDADSDGKDEPKELRGGGWRAHMGGALELFECDAAGAPARVALRAFPANNTLAFFSVGPQSFHQVGEVLSLELPRLSINGWFHGPALAPAPPPAAPPRALAPHSRPVLLNQWVESSYMSPRVRAQVQAQMERASEVCLRELLQPARAAALLAALDSAGGVGAVRAGAAAALLARGGALAGAAGGAGRAARGARAGAPAQQHRLPAPAHRLHRPAAQRLLPPRAAALDARGLYAAAGARELPAGAAGGGAVPGRAGARAERRPDGVRGAGGGRGRRRARDAAAAPQRAQPRVLRRRRRLLHQVPQPPHHAPRRALLHRHVHLHRVTRARCASARTSAPTSASASACAGASAASTDSAVSVAGAARVPVYVLSERSAVMKWTSILFVTLTLDWLSKETLII